MIKATKGRKTILCQSCGAKNPASSYSCSNCAASLIDVVTSAPSGLQSISLVPTKNSPWSSGTAISNTKQTIRMSDPIAVVKPSYAKDIVYSLIAAASAVFSFTLPPNDPGSFTGLIPLFLLVATVVIPIASVLERPKFEFYDTHLLKVTRRKTEQIDYSEIESVSRKWSAIRIKLKKSGKTKIFRRRAFIVQRNPRIAGGPDLSSWLERKAGGK